MKKCDRFLQCFSILLLLIVLLVSNYYNTQNNLQTNFTPNNDILSDQELLDFLAPSLVIINGIDLNTGVKVTGSGCIYSISDDEIVIVTAAHVLNSMKNPCEVLFYNGMFMNGEIVLVNENADIGMLRVDLFGTVSQKTRIILEPEGDSKLQFASLCEITISDQVLSNIKTNTEFCMIDLLTGLDNSLEESLLKRGSIVESAKYLPEFDQEMIYANGSATPGMSGTGLFDMYGNYIGMLIGMTDNGEIAAVPAAIIKRELSQFKIP